MAEQEQDRSEEATPYKREEARKKGSVARSQDMQAAVAVGMVLLVLMVSGPGMVRKSLGMFAALWSHAGELTFSPDGLMAWLSALTIELFQVFLPLWLVLMLAAIVAGIAQAGLVLSAEPLKPDWKRLNPIEGFKRLFTLQVLFEAAKSSVKFCVFSVVLYYALDSLLPSWLFLTNSGVAQIANATGGGVLLVMQRLLLAMLLAAVIDWLFVRRTLAKRLRMSKREVRDEHKRREGDPRIKSKLREIRLQFLQKTRSLARVKEADVLVVNPQHLALAIQYKRGQMAAPLLLAKGAGELAIKMKDVARRHGVPIMENKPLARGLYREVDVNEWIPDTYFGAVAKALVWAFKVRRTGPTA